MAGTLDSGDSGATCPYDWRGVSRHPFSLPPVHVSYCPL